MVTIHDHEPVPRRANAITIYAGTNFTYVVIDDNQDFVPELSRNPKRE